MKQVVFLAALMYSSATVFGMQGDKRVFSDQNVASSAEMNMVQVRDDWPDSLSRQLLEKQLLELEQNKEKAEKDGMIYFTLYEKQNKKKAEKDAMIYLALYEDAQRRKQDADNSIKTLTPLLEEYVIKGKEIVEECLALETSLDPEEDRVMVFPKDENFFKDKVSLKYENYSKGENGLNLEFTESGGHMVIIIGSLLRDYLFCNKGKRNEWKKAIENELSLEEIDEQTISKMIEQASEDKKKAEDEKKRLKEKAAHYVDRLTAKNKTLNLKKEDRLRYFKDSPLTKNLFITYIKMGEARESVCKADILHDILKDAQEKLTEKLKQSNPI